MRNGLEGRERVGVGWVHCALPSIQSSKMGGVESDVRPPGRHKVFADIMHDMTLPKIIDGRQGRLSCLLSQRSKWLWLFLERNPSALSVLCREDVWMERERKCLVN